MTSKTSIKITNKELITQIETLEKVLTADKHDNRFFCNYIYKEYNALYATDTKELAQVIVSDSTVPNFTKLSDGFYEVVKKGQKNLFLVDPEVSGINEGDNNYPDIKSFIEKELPNGYYMEFKAQNGKRCFGAHICTLVETSGIHFNFELLLKLEKVSNDFLVDYGKETEPIRFISGNFKYMVMPITKPAHLRKEERNVA